MNEFETAPPRIPMNALNIYLLVLALFVLTLFPSCQHIVYAADMANLNRRYARGEITKKEYDKQKAHFDFERSLAGPMITAGFTGGNQPTRTSRELRPAVPPATLLPGNYTYTPPPQYEYVYHPAHRPGGGYTPQPQQEYVYGPAHNPGGGYTPQPQQEYVYGPAHKPGGGYTPQPQQVYVQNAPRTPGVGYQAPPQQVYVQNSTSKSSGGGYTPTQHPHYVTDSGSGPSQPTSQKTAQSNANSDDPGDYIYGYDGSKQRSTEALTQQMAAQRENLANGTQAGLDTIEGAVAVTTGPSLWDRLKGAVGVAKNAPAAAKGVKDNAKAIVKPSPQKTGLGWQPIKAPLLPEGLKR